MTDFRAWASRVPAGEGRIVVEPGPISTIRIDHAATRNALDPAMMLALADVADAVRGARVLVITGANGAFCSGGNLGAVREHLAVPGAGAAFGAFMDAAVGSLTELDAVVIAAVDGAALGGGAELAIAADIVVGAPTARIGFVHARLGVSPGFGGGRRLLDRVGRRVATQVLTFARTYDAPAALALGLFDEVHAAPFERAMDLANELLQVPEGALRGARRVARGEDERTVFADLWGGPEHQAALRPRSGR